MVKITPNPPNTDSTVLSDDVESVPTQLNPPSEPKPPKRNGQLFSVCAGINTETLLANASEDLLSISAIAADLADGVDGSRRSKALALSRMADGFICWWSVCWIIWMSRRWRRFSPGKKTRSGALPSSK